MLPMARSRFLYRIKLYNKERNKILRFNIFGMNSKFYSYRKMTANNEALNGQFKWNLHLIFHHTLEPIRSLYSLHLWSRDRYVP